MTDFERDPIVRRAIDDLKRLPDADAAAMRRVVEAAAAARVTPADAEVAIPLPGRRPRWALRIGMLAAAAVIGFFARDAWRSRALTDATQAYDTPASIRMRPVANGERELVPVAQPFVFNSRTAHSVSIVGDFNGWKSTTSPMSRSADGSMWSATIPILPGRHAYGFMVDDSVFVLDPSAPKARDADLGADVSVLMVGRP
jgi:hypothetical protein